MKKKIMLAAAFAAIALMTAACGNKQADETSAAETAAQEETAETDEDTEAAEDEDDTAPDTDVSSYYSETPAKDFGTIASVDENTGEIGINTVIKGEAADGSEDSTDEVIYQTIDGVPIIDASTGLTAGLSDLKEGMEVYAWAGDTMTMSLPPQTNLQAMVINIQEDAAAPEYVVVKGLEWSKDDTDVTFTDQDGNTWHADTETNITPYLTKQIVRIEDIAKGSRMFVWPSDNTGSSDSNISKIVLMNE